MVRLDRAKLARHAAFRAAKTRSDRGLQFIAPIDIVSVAEACGCEVRFPDAVSPLFEASFTRLRCIGNNAFNVAYMRHTGKWVEVYHGLPLDECLATIKNEQIFHP